MKSNNKIIILILIIITISSTFIIINSFKKEKTTVSAEHINYKIVNYEGVTTMLMKTKQNTLTFYLKVTPSIINPSPHLFTIFMNGKQIECLWNNTIDKTYNTTIYPGKEKLIKIKIDNIPKGLNTLQFGTVYSPNKYDFKQEELYKNKYSLDLTPFTIIQGDSNKWSQRNLFEKYAQTPSIDKELPVGINGIFSTSKDKLALDLVSNTQELKKVYYFWQNTDKKTRKVRLSLLNNWEQISWPSGEEFIDIIVKPNDIFYKELDLPDIVTTDINQLTVIAFLNPDESFWYFDKERDEIGANHYGAIAFTTLRNIVTSN